MAKDLQPAELISQLVGRVTISKLRMAAQPCRGCDLWKKGTQAVFGEGKASGPGKRVMLVGEQPGDQEDLSGHPFVGPAGRLLDTALEEAGIDRALLYITNVVKHFKWEPRGKRRIHSKPNQGEVNACRPWIEAEIRVVKPVAIVCLGATAAQALIGRDFRVSRQRGKFVATNLGAEVIATVHPSSLLRAPDHDTREREMRRFVEDLAKVAPLLRG